jgi:flavin-binding protein dodecin
MNWPTKSAPPCVAYNGRHRHAHPPPRPRGGMTEQSGTATIVGSAVKDPASRSPAGIGDRQGRSVTGWPQQPRTGRMRSKESAMSVYRVTEIIGTSNTSWEDAAAEAIRTAAGTLRDLRVGEVVKQDIHLDEGGAITYRTKLQLSFKYEPEH